MPDAPDDEIDNSCQEHVADDENNCEIHGVLLSCQRRRSTFTYGFILDRSSRSSTVMLSSRCARHGPFDASTGGDGAKDNSARW